MGEQMGQGTRLVLQELLNGSLPESERRALLDALDAMPRDRSMASVYERSAWRHDTGAHAGSDYPYAYCPRCEMEHPAGAFARMRDRAERAEARLDEAYRHGREHEAYDRDGEIMRLCGALSRIAAGPSPGERIGWEWGAEIACAALSADAEPERCSCGHARTQHGASGCNQRFCGCLGPFPPEPSRAEGPDCTCSNREVDSHGEQIHRVDCAMSRAEGDEPGEHMWECGCIDDVEADGSRTPAVVCDDHQAPAEVDDGRSRAVQAADKAEDCESRQPEPHEDGFTRAWQAMGRLLDDAEGDEVPVDELLREAIASGGVRLTDPGEPDISVEVYWAVSEERDKAEARADRLRRSLEGIHRNFWSPQDLIRAALQEDDDG